MGIMSFFDTIYRWRIGLSLLIGVVMVIAAWNLKNEVVHAWQDTIHEGNEYRHSPGCVPTETQVDSSLSPCYNVVAQVTAKSRTVQRSYRKSYSREIRTNHNTLTLQDATHQTRKVYEISDRLWDVLAVGDTVQATVWKKGSITSLEAKGQRSVVISGFNSPLINNKVKLWGYTIAVCIVLLAVVRLISWSSRLL